jgi:type II secretory pathway component PulL
MARIYRTTFPEKIKNPNFIIYFNSSSSLIKTFNGLVRANVKTVNGISLASVKKFNGLA